MTFPGTALTAVPIRVPDTIAVGTDFVSKNAPIATTIPIGIRILNTVAIFILTFRLKVLVSSTLYEFLGKRIKA